MTGTLGTAMTPLEFVNAELGTTEAELGTAILNRSRWDALRENRQMLLHLQACLTSTASGNLRAELQRIVEGSVRVPTISGSRTKAADFLRRWASTLDRLDQPAVVEVASEPAG
jgi:hypothetical protein